MGHKGSTDQILMEVTVKMFQKRLRQVFTALIAATMLLSTLTAMAPPALMAAPAAETVTSDAVGGLLPGGQFSKIWLKVTPDGNADVEVTTEWDRSAPESNGLGFYILDKNGLASVLNGSKRPAQANLTAGSRASGAPDNQLSATIHPQVGEVTIVLYNDSPADANFTLKTKSAIISDDSNQVKDLKAAPTAASGGTVTGTVEAKAGTPVPAATTVTATATTAVTTAATTAPTATSTPVPAASAAVSSTLPSTVKVSGNVVTAPEMAGELPTQNTQHYFALVPSEKNGHVTLTLSYDPQDSTELARRLNFWVLDPDGFKRYTDATTNVVLSEIAIAAGSGAPGLQANQRQAKFTASGFGPYTVIVYNNSTVPATYQLVAQGATLTDDSQQSTTAQQAVKGGGVASTTTTAAATTESGSTAAPAATSAPAAGSTRAGEPGGTYTIKSGDSISLIARDIYGDINAWEALCKFNALADCNTIEVGQVLKLPTREQITSGAVPAATKAAVAAATATPAGAVAAAATTAASATTTATTTTTTTTESATSATPTATPKASATVSTTEGVTQTTSPSATGTTTTTKGSAAKGSVNLIQSLEAQGSFTTLVQALKAANLTAALEGAGPFTIFAPTDAAFAGLPSGALDQLLANPTGQLTQILLFHVLPGTVTSSDIQNGMQATTQQGKPVGFEVGSDGSIKINGAHVELPDIDASNGVIHPIDTVILPPPD